MRICWWLLVTVDLVWCSPDHLEDLYESENNVKSDNDLSEEPEHEPALHNDYAGNYLRIKRNTKEDEREKKQPKFHSWGGKRYGNEEDEENGENANTDQDYFNEEDPNQYMSLVPLQKINLSNSDDVENSQEIRSKRSQAPPAFSSWAGKRDPEVVNEPVKRPNLYKSILNNQAFATTKGDLGMKRYPSFNSWAGKRAAAFNSWGGKRAAAFNSWGGKRAAAFNSWGGKRAAAFNSWEDKRTAAFNSWGGKRAAAFNSWGGKRGAAFNSWGGKRAAAFNSWGGKRAAAFNSWGGKRGAAFNSWGGKRGAAFNSWGGKRGAAFNSWGGKRGAAFNSWGGKREDSDFWKNDQDEVNNIEDSEGINFNHELDAKEYNPEIPSHNFGFPNWKQLPDLPNNDALNIGDKRAAAFNSWGGKREFVVANNMPDQVFESDIVPQSQSGMLIKYEYNNSPTSDNPIQSINNPVNTKYIKNRMLQSYGISPENYINHSKTLDEQQHLEPHKFKDILYEDNDQSNVKQGTEGGNVLSVKRALSETTSSNLEHPEEFPWNSGDGQMEKKDRPFSSWAGKRSPLFSSWYGNKVPTMLLSSGKRRPAFSSWGGKRSMPMAEEDNKPSEGCTITNILKYGRHCHEEEDDDTVNDQDLEDEKEYKRKKREIDCDANNFMFTDRKGGCRDKRVGENVKKNRILTKMYFTWPLTFKSFPRSMDFYAWGGKRSL